MEKISFALSKKAPPRMMNPLLMGDDDDEEYEAFETNLKIRRLETGKEKRKQEPGFNFAVGDYVDVLSKPRCSWAPARLVAIHSETVDVVFLNPRCQLARFSVSVSNLRKHVPFPRAPSPILGPRFSYVEVSMPLGWMIATLDNIDHNTGIVTVSLNWNKSVVEYSIAHVRTVQRFSPEELHFRPGQLCEFFFEPLGVYTPVFTIQAKPNEIKVSFMCTELGTGHRWVPRTSLRPVSPHFPQTQTICYRFQQKVEVFSEYEVWDATVIEWEPLTDIVTAKLEFDGSLKKLRSSLVRPAPD